MTLAQAKSIARHLGFAVRQVHSGAYCVSFRDGNGTKLHCTYKLEDAIHAAIGMVRGGTFQPQPQKVV